MRTDGLFVEFKWVCCHCGYTNCVKDTVSCDASAVVIPFTNVVNWENDGLGTWMCPRCAAFWKQLSSEERILLKSWEELKSEAGKK